MARLRVYDIKWDETDPAYGKYVDPSTLPDEVEITVDDDYDEDYEPAWTLIREYGVCIDSLEYEELSD